MSYDQHREYLSNKFPAIQDLARRAQQRMPNVAWEYLQTGTGEEQLLDHNRQALHQVRFKPQFCKGDLKPQIATTLFGQSYTAPFGIAPVGLTGLMWPRAEVLLAQAAVRCQIPFSLSTVATETPETVGAHVGDMGWFQLYAPREKHLRKALLQRAWDSGFRTLLITADVPVPSRRERTKRAGMQMPPKITPAFIWQGVTHPVWSYHTIRRGLPSLRTVSSYAEFTDMVAVGKFVRRKLGGNLSWDICAELRDLWRGAVVIKGLLHPEDALEAVRYGMDGIVVSNHGARQFDGGIAAIDALPPISSVVNGQLKIIMDSGIRTGLDVLRALHLGADFVLCGRAFMYGVAALGAMGGDHVYSILADDLKNNMIQLGIEQLADIPHIK